MLVLIECLNDILQLQNSFYLLPQKERKCKNGVVIMFYFLKKKVRSLQYVRQKTCICY